MRFALGLTVLSVWTSACGGGARSTPTSAVKGGKAGASTATAAATGGREAPIGEDFTKYGRPATAAEWRAIATLALRYYAAAARDDGATACSLIYSIFEEAIAEDYGQPPAPPEFRGKTCPVVMSKVFRHTRGQPAAVLASTKVTGVRVNGRTGFVLLHSSAYPVGDMPVENERGVWKVDTLLGDACRRCSVPKEAIPPGTPSVAPPESHSAVPPEEVPPEAPGRARAEARREGLLKDLNDGDGDPGGQDDVPFLDYGARASAVDTNAIAAVVKRYYAAAAADDGGQACAQIYGIVAEGIAEEYAETPQLKGSSCAAVMKKMFAVRHSQMEADLAKLQVTRVRVRGQKAYAFVFLGKRPEPYVTVHRESGAWKMESLFEVGLP